PFVELAVAEPARMGLRMAFCVTTSVVSAAPARIGGRLGWGLPRELGQLTWSADGDDRSLWWDERGIELRGRPGRSPLPLLLPLLRAAEPALTGAPGSGVAASSPYEPPTPRRYSPSPPRAYSSVG